MLKPPWLIFIMEFKFQLEFRSNLNYMYIYMCVYIHVYMFFFFRNGLTIAAGEQRPAQVAELESVPICQNGQIFQEYEGTAG